MKPRKPYFLLRDMSADLRQNLELDAQDSRIPFQEIIRAILCDHYSLDCPNHKGVIRNDQWTGTPTVLLKLQPELFSAIKEDAAETGESMRSLVLAALESRYVTGGKS